MTARLFLGRTLKKQDDDDEDGLEDDELEERRDDYEELFQELSEEFDLNVNDQFYVDRASLVIVQLDECCDLIDENTTVVGECDFNGFLTTAFDIKGLAQLGIYIGVVAAVIGLLLIVGVITMLKSKSNKNMNEKMLEAQVVEEGK